MAGSRVLFTWFFLLLVQGFYVFSFSIFLEAHVFRYFLGGYGFSKKVLFTESCFSFVLLSESQRALRSQRRKPRIGGMHYDKGHNIFFFVSFVLFLALSTIFFGGGIGLKIRLSIIDSSFKCKLQMPRGNERGRTFDFCVQFKGPISMTQKICSY